MSNSTKKIVLDCERMKYANTGLYHYCLNLGLALQHNLNAENESLYLYVRQKTNADFNKDFNFINQHAMPYAVFFFCRISGPPSIRRASA